MPELGCFVTAGKDTSQMQRNTMLRLLSPAVETQRKPSHTPKTNSTPRKGLFQSKPHVPFKPLPRVSSQLVQG